MPKTKPKLPSPKKAKKQAKPEQPDTSQTLIKWLVVVGILALVVLPVVALKLAAWKYRQEEARNTVAADLLPAEAPKFGGPFKLMNQDGAPVTDVTFRGRYLLIYFGYTYCPDLCPTALQNIAETLDELGPEASKVQALYITIDPARDTPAKLKEYTASFDPRIIGLTGSPKQIVAVTKAYNVTYGKPEKVDDDEYVMEHSTLVYLVDPDGKPVTSMDMEDVAPVALADSLRKLWMNQKGPNK